MKFNLFKIISLTLMITVGSFAANNENTIPFDLKTHDGKAIDLRIANTKWNFKGYENKVILMNFFGTWCPPCKREIPHLNHIKDKFKDKFEIIALDIGNRDGSINSKEKLDDFIMQYNIKYPITRGSVNNEVFMGLSSLNPMGSIPFMVLFDSKGQFITEYVGMVSEERLIADISKAIK